MSKVKAKLKSGQEVEVYEHEKFRLFKKGLLAGLTKKEEEKYKDQAEAEKPRKSIKVAPGSQFDLLSKRVGKLEKESTPYDDKEIKDELKMHLETIADLEKRVKTLETKK